MRRTGYLSDGSAAADRALPAGPAGRDARAVRRGAGPVQTALDAAGCGALHSGGVRPARASARRVAARVLTPITSVERPGAARSPSTTASCRLPRNAALPGGCRDAQQRAPRTSSAIDARSRPCAPTLQEDCPRHGPCAGGAERVIAAPRGAGRATFTAPTRCRRRVCWTASSTGWTGRFRRLFRSPSPTRARHRRRSTRSFIKGLLIALLAGAFAVLVAVLVQWLRRRAPARPAAGPGRDRGRAGGGARHGQPARPGRAEGQAGRLPPGAPLYVSRPAGRPGHGRRPALRPLQDQLGVPARPAGGGPGRRLRRHDAADARL